MIKLDALFICVLLAAMLALFARDGAARAANAPQTAARVSDYEGLKDFAPGAFKGYPLIVQLKDGTFLAYVDGTSEGEPAVMCYASKDGGKPARLQAGNTWSGPDPVIKGFFGLGEVLVDRDDEVHLFFLNAPKTHPFKVTGGEESRPLVGQLLNTRIDIWYSRSSNGRKNWQTPRMIWMGYTGALNSVVQLKSGRILLPFSLMTNRTWGRRGGGFKEFTFVGQFDSTLIYSDDDGDTWHAANNLSVQSPDIVSAYGAVEPVCLGLDDRVWMLIRTQMGRFYESFSKDGAVWSRPKPSKITSSDSPAGLVRLSDGRIVLLWNNCQRYPYAYGGRQVLHAAISSDGGRTWRGYREVARDRLRNQPPPPTGDHGTAYPFPIATKDDKVLFRTGQGQGRVEIKMLDPAYLYQTFQKTDWSKKLDDWSVFGAKGVGLARPAKRDPAPRGQTLRPRRIPLRRTGGLVPDAASGPVLSALEGQALSVQKMDADFPAAAVWNFPMGRIGTMKLKLMVRSGCKGLNIGLTDHFSPPFDAEESFYNLFNLRVEPGGKLSSGGRIACDRWQMVQLDWDTEKGACAVAVDGKRAGSLRIQRLAEGACYLRLTAISDDPEPAGFLLASAEVDISRSF
jgi:hypothetical protein